MYEHLFTTGTRARKKIRNWPTVSVERHCWPWSGIFRIRKKHELPVAVKIQLEIRLIGTENIPQVSVMGCII